jgi:ABC-2 type transport system ATP-binding protein
LDGTNANQFLGQAIQQVDLKAFNENIPSFNEIFIKVVGEDANTIL